MSKPWSKLKSRIEALWTKDLPLAIHCTSYPFNTPGTPVRVSRHWITLDKAILWDFPGPFLSETPARGRSAGEFASSAYPNGGSIIGELLRDYLDRPRDALFEPFDEDGWELTDILRAADTRLGRQALLMWSVALDDGHPARRVLTRRFRQDRRTGPSTPSSRLDETVTSGG